ncbi:MAG TPA: 4Fe-4S dicluster domain-containing protein, partial [Acidimicrobiales bacterium]|nr:4Fe-4S dicluster domain-containing protein [Acidimicrobiales bacterium]
KCDMCYDRTAVGLKPMCASVCPSQALWFGSPEEYAATRTGTLVNEWRFGNQHVATKVRTVAGRPGPIDVLGAAGARPWQDDPFGLGELDGAGS